MVRALLYEYFLSFHLDLLEFSLLPRLPFFFMSGFLRVFRHGKPGVTTLLSSQELLGEQHEVLLRFSLVSVLP